jgi:hypothetical protein
MYLKKIAAIGVCAMLIATPGLSFIFGGLPVFDAGSFSEALIQSAHMVDQLRQMQAQLKQMKDEYDHLKQQAMWLKDMAKYRSISTVWKQLAASDTYGRNAPWVSAVNTGMNAQAAWDRITRRATPYDKIPAEVADIYQNDYATIELQDGSAINTIDLVGRIRQAGPQRESVLAQLENDSFANSLEMQTEAAQLNKANALAIFNAKQAMDQNRLITNLLEMNLLRLKQERDAQVHSMNEAAYSQRRASYYMTDTQGGPSQAMRDFSISLH